MHLSQVPPDGRRYPEGVGDSDTDNLRILVELAARGELSASDTADVEALIADKPHLVSEYQRLRAPAAAPPSTDSVDAPRSRPRSTTPNGCLVGVVGMILGVVMVLTIGIAVRSDGGSDPVDPVSAVLADPDNRVLELSGPDDLVAMGTLALMYSPSQRSGVLLGNGIVSDGELLGDGVVLVTFQAGTVEQLLPGLDPDQRFVVRATN